MEKEIVNNIRQLVKEAIPEEKQPPLEPKSVREPLIVININNSTFGDVNLLTNVKDLVKKRGGA